MGVDVQLKVAPEGISPVKVKSIVPDPVQTKVSGRITGFKERIVSVITERQPEPVKSSKVTV